MSSWWWPLLWCWAPAWASASPIKVRRVLPQRTQWSGAVRLTRGASRIRAVDAGFGRRVQCALVVVRAGPADVAAGAASIEHATSARGDDGVNTAGRRRRRRQAVLIGAQRRQLRCDKVRRMRDVDPEPTFRSRFGQPSMRRPMPRMTESSTVE